MRETALARARLPAVLLCLSCCGPSCLWHATLNLSAPASHAAHNTSSPACARLLGSLRYTQAPLPHVAARSTVSRSNFGRCTPPSVTIVGRSIVGRSVAMGCRRLRCHRSATARNAARSTAARSTADRSTADDSSIDNRSTDSLPTLRTDDRLLYSLSLSRARALPLAHRCATEALFGVTQLVQ